MTEENKAKTINLYCPSLSKIARIVAWEDQRLDLGSIAGTFGLEPSTLKLNGHFISRGVDLIASSVTWKSLLSFFSARGLSTGTADSSALVVDGKLSKSGTKRAHGTAAAENGVLGMPLQGEVGDGGKPWHEDTNVLKKQKLKDSNCGYENEDSQMTLSISSGLKRKHWLENSSLFKKSKASGIYSVDNNNMARQEMKKWRAEEEDDDGNEGNGNGKSWNSKFPPVACVNVKRRGEDEVLVASSSCKRMR